MNNRSAPYKIFSLPITIPGHEAVSYLYLIRSERTALIDTGPACSLAQVTTALAELRVPLSEIDFILGTHIHLDHLGGLSQALSLMPHAKVIVHPRGIGHLIDPLRLWQASLDVSGDVARKYGQPEAVPQEKLIAAREGQTVDLGGVRLEILYTPGHAPHHLSFFEKENGNLFVGEAAGIYFPDDATLHPASPPPFNLRQSFESLEKMIALNPQTIYYCHYGSAPDAMSRLTQFGRCLNLWSETIRSFFTPDTHLSAELVETIVDAIIARDGAKALFEGFSNGRQQSELYFMSNNVSGIWDYFQRKGPL